MEKEQLKQLQDRILKVFDEAMKRLNDHRTQLKIAI